MSNCGVIPKSLNSSAPAPSHCNDASGSRRQSEEGTVQYSSFDHTLHSATDELVTALDRKRIWDERLPIIGKPNKNQLLVVSSFRSLKLP